MADTLEIRQQVTEGKSVLYRSLLKVPDFMPLAAAYGVEPTWDL
jgi:hypothetical protein